MMLYIDNNQSKPLLIERFLNVAYTTEVDY